VRRRRRGLGRAAADASGLGHLFGEWTSLGVAVGVWARAYRAALEENEEAARAREMRMRGRFVTETADPLLKRSEAEMARNFLAQDKLP
jgi:hypothetical protein